MKYLTTILNLTTTNENGTIPSLVLLRPLTAGSTVVTVVQS